VIVVGLVSTALAGQVSVEPIELTEVIARSEVIVYGTIADPPTSIAKRAVGEGCEGQTSSRYHITVGQVLRTTPDGPAERDRLTAWAGYAGEMLELAQRECKDGTRKSPIHQSYGGHVDWVAGETVVLFLRWVEPHGWELTVMEAWEPGKKVRKIEKLLAPTS
jgi:hypothetical protein